MTSVFWDSEGGNFCDVLPRDGAINMLYYIDLLLDVFRIAIRKTMPGELPQNIIVLHENACLHTVDLTMTLATLDWEIMKH